MALVMGSIFWVRADFVNALDLPLIPKTKLLGALKPHQAMQPGIQMGTVKGV